MAEAMSDYGVITEAGTIRFERLLPGPIERVWDYLVDGEKRAKWLAHGDMEPSVGSEFELVWRNNDLSSPGDNPPPKYAEHEEYRAKVHVLEYDPPHKLVTSWDEEGEVSYELAERGDQVLLTLTHRNLKSRGLLVGVAGGWHSHLELLRNVLEGSDRISFWATHTRLEAEYEQRIPA